jgi:hypothetical protein
VGGQQRTGNAEGLVITVLAKGETTKSPFGDVVAQNRWTARFGDFHVTEDGESVKKGRGRTGSTVTPCTSCSLSCASSAEKRANSSEDGGSSVMVGRLYTDRTYAGDVALAFRIATDS